MIALIGLLGCLASFLLLDKKIAIKNVLLKGVLAFYFAISVWSFFFALFLFAKIDFMVFQIVFLLAPLFYILFVFQKDKKTFGIKQFQKFPTFLLIVILSALLLFTKEFFATQLRWGEWDAWGIWSQHAIFLSNDMYFANLFNNEISWTHPDYPLMLPAIIAMAWKSIGSISPEVPALFSYAIAVSMLLLILSSFFEKRFTVSGMFVFLVLSGTLVLFPFVNAQVADTILAAFILVPVVLMHHLSDKKSNNQIILIGFFAASCGWVKNEGLVFFALFAFFFFIKYFKQKKYIKFFMIGTAFPLLVLMLFKIGYAPSVDLLEDNKNITEKLLDINRYGEVWEFGSTYFIENGMCLIYLLAIMLVLNYKYYFSYSFLLAAGLFSAYILIYIITPHNLFWHLSTSFSRLLHQLVPLLIYSTFFYIATYNVAGFWNVLFRKVLKKKQV